MLIDRFGHIPVQLENLLSISRLKLVSSLVGIRSIFKRENTIVIRMNYDLKDMRLAFQKRFTNQAEIGNREIRQPITGNSTKWMKNLFNLVNDLYKFQVDMKNHLENRQHTIK